MLLSMQCDVTVLLWKYLFYAKYLWQIHIRGHNRRCTSTCYPAKKGAVNHEFYIASFYRMSYCR